MSAPLAPIDVMRAIEAYVQRCGRDYSRWCIGTAADALDRLLNVHGVEEEGDGCGWIIHQCAGAEQAAAVRNYFLARGMKSTSDDAGPTATSVYAFKLTGTESPRTE